MDLWITSNRKSTKGAHVDINISFCNMEKTTNRTHYFGKNTGLHQQFKLVILAYYFFSYYSPTCPLYFPLDHLLNQITRYMSVLIVSVHATTSTSSLKLQGIYDTGTCRSIDFCSNLMYNRWAYLRHASFILSILKKGGVIRWIIDGTSQNLIRIGVLPSYIMYWRVNKTISDTVICMVVSIVHSWNPQSIYLNP